MSPKKRSVAPRAVDADCVAPPEFKLSVVVPTYNEEGSIGETIEAVFRQSCCGRPEVLVVDGGSTDRTLEVATSHGAKVLRAPKPGRGPQMDVGARAAQGSVVMFLHADTELPLCYDRLLLDKLKDQAPPRTLNPIAGAFSLGIRCSAGEGEDNSRTPKRTGILRRAFGRFTDCIFCACLKGVELGANLRSLVLREPYGDQALWAPMSVYHSVGGMPHQPLLEDVEFVARLHTAKIPLVILPEKVSTSDRRWRKKGIIRTTLTNFLCRSAYAFCVSPDRIVQWYYPKRKP